MTKEENLYNEMREYFGFMEEGRKSYIMGLISKHKEDVCNDLIIFLKEKRGIDFAQEDIIAVSEEF